MVGRIHGFIINSVKIENEKLEKANESMSKLEKELNVKVRSLKVELESNKENNLAERKEMKGKLEAAEQNLATMKKYHKEIPNNEITDLMSEEETNNAHIHFMLEQHFQYMQYICHSGQKDAKIHGISFGKKCKGEQDFMTTIETTTEQHMTEEVDFITPFNDVHSVPKCSKSVFFNYWYIFLKKSPKQLKIST